MSSTGLRGHGAQCSRTPCDGNRRNGSHCCTIKRHEPGPRQRCPCKHLILSSFSAPVSGIQVACYCAMQSAPVQLSVRNVRKSFSGKAGEVRVLGELSFAINERGFVSIIGPSGCGKTTIFNIIAGLLEPDSGWLYYRGEEIESLRGRV